MTPAPSWPLLAAACPVAAWARSGCMALTGRSDGPPAFPATDVMGGLTDLARRLRVATGVLGAPVDLDLASTLSGRAALLGFTRSGSRSVGGSARLLRSADGWVALNLARPEDHDSVPALVALLGWTQGASGLGGFGPGAEEEGWGLVDAAVCRVPGAQVAEAGALLGIPVAVLGAVSGGPAWSSSTLGLSAAAPGTPLVVDLSSLWAGPLCSHLLIRAGFRVVKVEHARRLDGARQGDPRVWAWLNEGKEPQVLDFSSVEGREGLAALLARADVVIEASRGRALDQLGLGPGQVSTRPGAVWVTITGYGRASARVAFGDDAAVAGGLVAWDDEGPMFCGDAMGDPVAGLTAAVAVTEALASGGGVRLDLSMAAAVAAVARDTSCALGQHPLTRGADGSWVVTCAGRQVAVCPPVSPI